MLPESLLPKKSHTTQPKQQGRSTEKPTRIESIRNILTCHDMTHIGKLLKKNISHPRKGGGFTGSKWCFPSPSQCISWAYAQSSTKCLIASPFSILPTQASHAIKGLSAFPLCLCTIPSLPSSPKEGDHHGSVIHAHPSYPHCRLH